MNENITIPVLETERLLLRVFRAQDLDPFTEIVADPRVMEYATYSGKTMNRSQAWNWLCMMLGHWHLRGFGIWAVEEKASGILIGRTGLQFLEWFDEVELVWMLAQGSWEKEYAKEGASAAIEYAFQHLHLPVVSAVIRIDNQRSIRVAEKLGMSQRGELEREGVAFYDYRLDNPSS
jgi:RimJ/RimL family protein N-acetyltransferase